VALHRHVFGGKDNLERVLGRGLVVATHYSGTGVAEMVFAKIAPERVMFHSACDLDPMCRGVLLNLALACAVEHALTDLSQRPPAHLVVALRAALQTLHAALASRTSTSSRAELAEVTHNN